MANGLIRNWRLVIWRGILALVFGLVTFLWQDIQGYELVVTFGLYALADGLIAAGTSFVPTRNRIGRWAFLLEGLAGVGAGISVLVLPGLPTWMPVFLIAIWAMITGGLEILAAIRLRDSIINDWLLVWGGGISLALGILAFFQPQPGDGTLIWALGSYGLAFGILLMTLGFGLRRRNLPGDRSFLRPII
ncbi:MAG: HdeD family acid-resistance protein [Bacteroidota bacterium]